MLHSSGMASAHRVGRDRFGGASCLFSYRRRFTRPHRRRGCGPLFHLHPYRQRARPLGEPRSAINKVFAFCCTKLMNKSCIMQISGKQPARSRATAATPKPAQPRLAQSYLRAPSG